MQSEVIDQIRAWHRKRNFAMETRKRADLALGSSLRSWLGWRKDLPDADRARIADQADKLIECGEKIAKGKPHELSDTEEFKEYEAIILVAVNSRAPTDAFEKIATKEMERLAGSLPVWSEFGEQIRGFGARSLAVIIGEAGDLSNYSTHSKLWKRMGLAVMDGVRQGGLRKAATKETWIAHGYSPVRRSRMFVIGDTLIKSNGNGVYRSAYLARKQYERVRANDTGLVVAPAAKIPAKRKDEFMSDGHVHLRAQRYMEKRLLRDLWKAWRQAQIEVLEKDGCPLPAAEITDAAQAAGQAQSPLLNRASTSVPDHLLPDAPQGAGAAGDLLPAKAYGKAPPHQFVYDELHEHKSGVFGIDAGGLGESIACAFVQITTSAGRA